MSKVAEGKAEEFGNAKGWGIESFKASSPFRWGTSNIIMEIATDNETKLPEKDWTLLNFALPLFSFLLKLKRALNGKDAAYADWLLLAAWHCPANLKFYAVAIGRDELLFKVSLQYHEDLRITEEEQAPSGWDFCCAVVQFRQMSEALIPGDLPAQNTSV